LYTNATVAVKYTRSYHEDMRTLALVLLLAATLEAQRGGFRGGGFRGGGFRGGPGIGRGAGGYYGGGFRGPVMGRAPGGYYRGGHYGTGYRPGGYSRIGGYHGGYIRRPAHVGWPAYRYGRPYRGYGGIGAWYGFGGGWWGWPGYSYGYYGSPYWGPSLVSSPAAPYPYYTEPVVVDTTPSSASPSVIIINQDYRAPASRASAQAPPENPSPAAEAPATRSPVYLIASKNNVIWAADAYWMEGTTLHFIGVNKERRQIDLSQVDRELTEQLNAERRVSMRLP
jgi:hypothetical protein